MCARFNRMAISVLSTVAESEGHPVIENVPSFTSLRVSGQAIEGSALSSARFTPPQHPSCNVLLRIDKLCQHPAEILLLGSHAEQNTLGLMPGRKGLDIMVGWR
jgi:hypothetical protein